MREDCEKEYYGEKVLKGIGYNKSQFEGDILFQKICEDGIEIRNILLRTYEKRVACFDEKGNTMFFTMGELFAINMYCKELGWM